MWPYIAAIIWRPSKVVIDDETGEKSYIQEEFNTDKIEFRKKVMLQQPAITIMASINFFLNGNKESMKIIQDSMNQKEVQELQ